MDLDEPKTAVIPKAGRRRQQESSEAAPSEAAPSTTKTGGWGEGGASSAGSAPQPAASLPRSASIENTRAAPAESLTDYSGKPGEARQGRRAKEETKSRDAAPAKKGGKGGSSSDEGDVPAIPDIEEMGGGDDSGDITRVVAEAPRGRTHQVLTLAELDSNTPFSIANADVNLGLLTAVLSPPNELKEEDVPWTFESLFAEVSYSINSVLEQKELSKGKKTVTAE